jgi:phosphoribosylaminoimidazole-succinocarboxamide synthase
LSDLQATSKIWSFFQRILLSPASPILQTTLADRRPDRQGKVRDIYDFGNRLLIVATDRISAFDHVLASGIPDKGKVLTQLSAFWFDHLGDLVPHHAVAVDVDTFPAAAKAHRDILRGRSMIVKKAQPLPVECVARGYITGSGWKDYGKTGAICGVPLPQGLKESQQLSVAIFTPATKAETGHDENISEADAGKLVGASLIRQMRELTLAIYERGVVHASKCGIMIADTKVEFGLVGDTLTLIDEVLTPDSSRFWPEDSYAPGRAQPSYDKQYVRDYLEQIGWNKQTPAPALSDEVITRTREKYLEAYRRLTGVALDV